MVTNASKFGTQATTLWAKAGALSFDSARTDIGNFANSQLTNLAGGLTNSLKTTVNQSLAGFNAQLTSVTGGLVGDLSSITKPLTNLIPGSLTNLNSNLDLFGKSGTFATTFADPLGSLDKLSTNVKGQALAIAGQIEGQALAIAGQIEGQALAIAGQIEGQARALAGRLEGAFGNLGELFSGSGDLFSGTKIAAGFNNTVKRDTLDTAFARTLGSDKIPLPTFQYPSIDSLSDRLDIQQAKNFLKDLQNKGRQIAGTVTQTQAQIQGVVTQAQGIATQAQNTFNRFTG